MTEHRKLMRGPRTGRIVAAFGRHYEVLPTAGLVEDAVTSVKCSTRGKKSTFACGDLVDFEATGSGQGVIDRLIPRENLLWRSDAFRQKLIAANLTQIVIVVATEPGFSDLLVSRCIAAAESEGLASLIVLNKADLTERLVDARTRLEVFRALGYPVLEVCAHAHIDALSQRLAGQRSILVGQSGMGKSTLTNALIPEARAATREISSALDTGKHTTTFARLYAYGEEGWIIDSPGLQAFGLAHLEPDTLAEQFVEFRPHLGQCRFRDCRHDGEPSCAIGAALARGEISAVRLNHFRTIRAEIIEARKEAKGW